MKLKPSIIALMMGILCIISGINQEIYGLFLPITFFILTFSALYLAIGKPEEEFTADETAERMLYLLKKYKKYFDSGLCSFIDVLEWADKISKAEEKKLEIWINNNAPTAEIYRKLKTKNRIERDYYFKFGYYDIRVKWLEYLVKKGK